MSAIRPDGSPIPLPAPPGRYRGRSLSPAGVRRMRDLVGSILVNGAGLSPADALAVFQASPIGYRQFHRRLDETPRDVHQALAQIRRTASQDGS